MVAYLYFRLIYPKMFLAYLQIGEKEKKMSEFTLTQKIYFFWKHFKYFENSFRLIRPTCPPNLNAQSVYLSVVISPTEVSRNCFAYCEKEVHGMKRKEKATLALWTKFSISQGCEGWKSKDVFIQGMLCECVSVALRFSRFLVFFVCLH
jgi:hypothetical protein